MIVLKNGRIYSKIRFKYQMAENNFKHLKVLTFSYLNSTVYFLKLNRSLNQG